MKLPRPPFVTTILGTAVVLLAVAAQAQEKIKIGVSTALTGNAATYGEDIKNVLQFANEKLAGNKYELIFDDDKCSGRDAVTVAHRFLDVLKLKYVIGFACSSTVLSTAGLYDKSGVLVMVTSASAADISKAGDHIFRTWASDAGAAARLYEHIVKRHAKLGILSEQTDYAQGFLRSFEGNNASGRLEIINENYLSDSTDYRTLILKLRSRQADSIFINSQSEATFLAILRQLREMKWSTPIYSAYWAGTSTVLDKAADLAEGSIFVDLPGADDALTEEGRQLYADFKGKYGRLQSVDLVFGTTLEGFRALHAAVESGKDLREFLYGTKFKGVFGEWYFDSNGDIQGLDFVIKRVRNGRSERFSD